MNENREKSVVVAVRCDTYEEETVYRAVYAGLAAMQTADRIDLQPAERVLVKPNLLKPAEADSAVTTHPAVLRAVLRWLQVYGCRDVVYGDSPGHDTGAKVIDRLQLDRSTDLYGARFTPMTKEVRTAFPDGMTAKEFWFAEEVGQIDAVVNVCKMKTHALMGVTGAVKNTFGLICGTRKAMAHVQYPDPALFARMLVDLQRCVQPRLHIMDAITAMEGNGPGSGTPTSVNLLLFSRDPVALDAVFCNLIAVDPEAIPTCAQGEVMGLGTWQKEKIRLLLAAPDQETEDLSMEAFCAEFGKPDFQIERENSGLMKKGLGLLNRLSRRPVIHADRCIACGVCVNHCPVPGKALSFRNGPGKPPVYDYQKCIRCYCCQELCPRQAITAGRRRGVS